MLSQVGTFWGGGGCEDPSGADLVEQLAAVRAQSCRIELEEDRESHGRRRRSLDARTARNGERRGDVTRLDRRSVRAGEVGDAG